jgi:hypothetical protein
MGSLVQCSSHITSHCIGEWGSIRRVWVSPAGDNNPPSLSLSKVLMENNNVSTGPDSCKCDTSTCVPAGYIKVLEKKCSLSSYQKIVPFIKRYYDMAKSKHFYPINSNDDQSCSIWLWHLCKHMRCDCRYAVRILYGFIPLLTTSDSWWSGILALALPNMPTNYT